MKAAEAKETDRKETAQKFATQSVPAWTMNLVTTGKLVAPAKAEKVVKKTIQPIESVKVATTDLSTKGTLNGAAQSNATPAWLAILPSRTALAS